MARNVAIACAIVLLIAMCANTVNAKHRRALKQQGFDAIKKKSAGLVGGPNATALIRQLTPVPANATIFIPKNATTADELTVVQGYWNSTRIPRGNTTLTTAQGAKVIVEKTRAGNVTVFVPGASVVVIKPDIPVDGNIVHLINTMLPANFTAGGAKARRPLKRGESGSEP